MSIRIRVLKIIRSPSIINLMYIPAIILFCVFIIYPFILGIRYSFTDWNGYNPTYHFVGFDKYKLLFTDKNIKTVIINTLIFGIGSTFFQNIFGLSFALLLDKKIIGRNVVRTIIYLPVIISALIIGYIWYFCFQLNSGAVNDIIKFFGGSPINFLTWGKNSIGTVWLIMAVNVYQYVGISMMIYLAGIQSISKDYFEAASLDGASAFKMFKHITLPLLLPAITVNIVINLIGGLKLFDVIVAMTNGGPGYSTQSLSTMMYQLYFSREDAGYAAALGIFMFCGITLISLTALVLLRRKEVQQ